MTKWINLLLALVLIACEAEDGVVGTGVGGNPDGVITGFAQKGPFAKGSKVVITELTPQGNETTNIIETVTKDAMGRFEFKPSLNTLYLITIEGIHLNENTGLLSQQPLLLRSIYYHNDANNKLFVVNVITHLISYHVWSKIMNGIAPDVAFNEAYDLLGQLVLNEMLPNPPQRLDLMHLSIYDLNGTDEVGNALLLYISASIYEAAALNWSAKQGVGAELAYILDTLSGVLVTGTAVPVEISDALWFGSRMVNPKMIEKHLTQYSYDVLGVALPVADIDSILDTDADGLLNNEDPDDDGDAIPDEEDPHPNFFEFIAEDNQVIQIPQNTSVQLDLNFNHTMVLPYNVNITKQPEFGSIVPVAPYTREFVYTPNEGFVGNDSIRYYVEPMIFDTTIFKHVSGSEEVTVILEVTSQIQ